MTLHAIAPRPSTGKRNPQRHDKRRRSIRAGMSGLGVRAAKRLNRVMRRSGKVLDGR
ncbi:MAG: hypothetical protein LC659_00020 [Myxococcales bacterium]|nr:hypothetical protein [Myxococcales bacterium]